MLIAQDIGMTAVFVTFGYWQFVPTLISLLLAFMVLRHFYKDEFRFRPVTGNPIIPCDWRVTLSVRFSLAIILLLVAANIVASLLGDRLVIALPLITLAAAAPVLLLSERRWTILICIDGATLVFFAAMVVLMESVW